MAASRGPACDSCKRRRVRCNGVQPCDRCQKSSVLCTFGSLISRASGVSYTRYLERRIADLEAALPPSNTAAGKDDSQVDHAQGATGQVIDILTRREDDFYSRSSQGTVHYYGCFAAINVLRIVADLCAQTSNSCSSHSTLGSRMLEALDNQSLVDRHHTVHGGPPALPSRNCIDEYINRTADTVLVCHDCLDHQDLSRLLDRLYATDTEDYCQEDNVSLALVYAIVACGRRYAPRVNDQRGLKGVNDFRASCALLDRNGLLTLNSIRAMILQARFLLSTAMTSAAYTLISAAVAAARRMGLDQAHDAAHHIFTPDECFRRRQILAVLYMMDTYFASILGMPKILTHVARSQTIGLPDDDLVDEGTSFVERNPTSPVAETALCQKLFHIHVQLLDCELKSCSHNAGKATLPADSVASLEAEISQWAANLPDPLHGMHDSRATNAQLVLRLHHAAAQVTLYRPFLHHIAYDRSDLRFNAKGFEYASHCVQAATQAIWIVEAMQTHGFFHEAIWFNSYSLAFATTILCYFVVNSKQRVTIDESIDAARRAQILLEALSSHNGSARAFLEQLRPILDSLEHLSLGKMVQACEFD